MSINLQENIIITDEILDINVALDFVRDNKHGAMVSFIGTIRSPNQEREVLGVSYDVHETLALAALKQIAAQARAEYSEGLKFYIAHANGHVKTGAAGIIIAVSAKHRREALRACDFIIEKIKHEVPIWKQEHYVDGQSEWLQGHALCQHD